MNGDDVLFVDGSELERLLEGVLEIRGNQVWMHDADLFREDCVEVLVQNAVRHPDEGLRRFLAWLVRDAARAVGVHPASMRGLYDRVGRGEIGPLTVPAIHLRVFPFDLACAVFRAARAMAVGPIAFQLANEEIDWLALPPAAFAACVLGAAVRERHLGPVFLQLDHLAASAWAWGASEEDALDAIEARGVAAFEAGFYNVQIDACSLTAFGKPTLEEQLDPVIRGTAAIAARLRAREIHGTDPCIGAELGVEGTRRANAAALRLFLDRVESELASRAGDVPGLSKIGLRPGLSPFEAAMPLPPNADAIADYETIRDLGEIARREHRLAGVVEHEASTLPRSALAQLPDLAVCEVDFGRLLQDLVLDLPGFPKELRRAMELELDGRTNERIPDESTEAFHDRALVRVLGAFQDALFRLPDALRREAAQAAERELTSIFEALRLRNTLELMHRDTLGHLQEEPVAVPAAGLHADAEGMYRALLRALTLRFRETTPPPVTPP